MSSSYKTPFLGLSKFIGSDKPKMDDVNFDNSQLDTKIKQHFENLDSHVTAQDKSLWNSKAPGMILGSYIGNGEASRTVNLGFNPSFGFIFCMNSVIAEYDNSKESNNQLSGFLTQQGASLGITAIQNGFTVVQMSVGSFMKERVLLNSPGKTYIYIMFK